MGFVGCVSFHKRTASLKGWHTAILFQPLLTTPKRPESDVESSKGLHQGDLCVRLCFASVVVPVATSALQGFVAVPLLLPLLLLQPLLFSPLFVCDLCELVFICFVFFTWAGPCLIVFGAAFI